MTCRICAATTRSILDLGESPPANALLSSPSEDRQSFPLVLELCDACGNLQLRDCLDTTALYGDYLYVTPDSQLLTSHYEQFYEYLARGRYLRSDSFVLEVGSNAGKLLRFLQPRTRKVLGIDPAANICKLAQDNGIETVCDFFGPDAAERIRTEHGIPDVIIARHCMAHNPDPHLMISAAAALLPTTGHLVIENAYGLNTIENNEFDQVYHEHMFYFTIRSMRTLLQAHGMHLVSVLMAPVHGGSIVFVAKRREAEDVVDASFAAYSDRENRVLTDAAFEAFAANAYAIKDKLRSTVDSLKAAGSSVWTYGATAKGNTLLNFVGFTHRDFDYCVDSTPLKQGKFLPKSRIPIVSEQWAFRDAPDYFLLTAWNYKEEIVSKVRAAGNMRSRFILPIPRVEVV